MINLKSFKRTLLRRKKLDCDNTNSKLEKCLSTFDLTALGIGSTLGLGIYVLAGKVASEKAGPAVCISFLFAAIASVFAGICYAEFGARVPKAGSAYVYSYVTVGEFIAFVIGWNLILEYVIGTASVARGYSEYIDSMLNQTIQQHMNRWVPINISFLSAYPDLLAFSITIMLTIMLMIGVKESTKFNSFFTNINLLVVLFVIVYGSLKADFHNWNLSEQEVQKAGYNNKGGFMPFGIVGVMTGAATCFYGFIGFDVIATTGEEAKNPQKSIPISIIISLLFIFLAYFGVSSIQTLMWPFYDQSHPAPLPYVFEQVGLPVAKWIISFGAIAGLSTSLLGAMFPLPRILYAMASDGLIFKSLAEVNPRFKTPMFATLISGLFAGFMAAFFNIDELADMMSIGTLLAYTLVSISVLILRFSIDANQNITIKSTITNEIPIEDLNKNIEINDKKNIEILNQNKKIKFSLINIIKQFFNLNNFSAPNHFTSIFSNYMIIFISFIIIVLDIILAYFLEELIQKQFKHLIALTIILSTLIFAIIVLYLQPQNKKPVSFQVPLVPILPLLSVMINIYLMLNLSKATWIRFCIWMFIGLCIYFFYGITNSVERKSKKNLLPILTYSENVEKKENIKSEITFIS